ncbi:BglG family transcription antiterminator [Vagococcus sp. BWB3-3]|uniref:BglG family transcription antiterminator n=1 Tax=Vagococcus allomyrinae TaxID=2794353 RepID=A0A940PAM6_9ENTE|nr:BglG family transcription antiterminator [Vagococcus allomyrinae]MBP1040533.1 BglG family transcription antiterminator [Vagococcus allomyrinae]
MYLSARPRLILEQLMMAPQPLHLADVAEEFEVSERTIRRDLKEVKATLATFNLKLTKEKHYLSVQGSEDDKQRFKWQLLDLTYNDFSPEERQQYILKELLKTDGTLKLIGLANDLNVTVSTISNDLTKIEEDYLNSSLISRKKGMGISLNASEMEKRGMLSDLFWKKYPKQQFMRVLFNQFADEVTEGRLNYITQQGHIEVVEQSLRNIRDSLAYDITDESYINLVIHVAISVQRITEGNGMKETLINPEVVHYPEFHFAQELLVTSLGLSLAEVPIGEVEFVTMHLRGAKAQNYVGDFNSNEQVQAVTIATQLIAKVSEKTGSSLTSDSLLKSLTAHLRPALRRLNADMSITNPLIHSIKRDYEELFGIVQASMKEIYHYQPVPEEEIGYLVLHFGAALLQQEEQVALSALVVCASGIGTSRMLVTRLKQAIPQLKTLKTISLFELTKEMESHPYDLLVSTIDLGQVDYEYFHVTPILSEREISQIEVYLQNKRSHYRRKQNREEKEQQLTKLEAIHLLENRQLYTETVVTLLSNFQVVRIDNSLTTIEDTLRAICTTLLEQDRRLDVEGLLQSLLVREKWSGFGIAETELALFHARNASIRQPIFQLFPLTNPIMMPAMGGGEVQVATIVLLLAPEKLEQQGLELMSQISSLLIESEATTACLQSGDSRRITQFVVERLLAFANSYT